MSMHPDEGGEWDAFREATLEVSPRAILPYEAGQPFVAVVGGRLEDAQWAVGYQRYDDGKLYQEMAGRHRAQPGSIQIINTAVLKPAQCRREHVKEMHDSKLKFPIIRKLPHVPMKLRSTFNAKRPMTFVH